MIRRILLSLAITAGLAVTSVAITASPASAGQVGSADIQGYCQATYGSAFNATTVAPHDAWSWRCYRASTQTWHGINMNLVCMRQFGNFAYAVPLSSNPYSWRCYV
ncbi:hypothetical protein AB0B94_30585 [Micromonospora sp. NPDC048986]|uniref:hypothetical protein n=1 Tax=Micromonospora sp. NPDC048986 TaxID=3155644 RepID=UPI0033DF268B